MRVEEKYKLELYSNEGLELNKKIRKYFAVDYFSPGDFIELGFFDVRGRVHTYWFNIQYIYEDNSFLGKCMTFGTSKSVDVNYGDLYRMLVCDFTSLTFTATGIKYTILNSGILEKRNMRILKVAHGKQETLIEFRDTDGFTLLKQILKDKIKCQKAK